MKNIEGLNPAIIIQSILQVIRIPSMFGFKEA